MSEPSSHFTPLDMDFNFAVQRIANRLFPTGFNVEFDEAKVPNSLAGLTDMIASTGRMTVWGGESEHSIYADPEVNYAGRAWHDWCHWAGQHEFTPLGEFMVLRMQQQTLAKMYPTHPSLAKWQDLLAIDVLGNMTHMLTSGEFPEDQRAFTEACLAA